MEQRPESIKYDDALAPYIPSAGHTVGPPSCSIHTEGLHPERLKKAKQFCRIKIYAITTGKILEPRGNPPVVNILPPPDEQGAGSSDLLHSKTGPWWW